MVQYSNIFIGMWNATVVIFSWFLLKLLEVDIKLVCKCENQELKDHIKDIYQKKKKKKNNK